MTEQAGADPAASGRAALRLAGEAGETRATAVAAELRRLIVTGQLLPGARLRQAEIASWFEISTTPVREAFAALAREGLVVRDAHRGVEVARFSLADFTENCEIRFRLEPLATELAAAAIPEATLDELEGALEELADLPVDHQDERRTELNNLFHETIYGASERPRLIEMIRSLRQAGQAYVAIFANRRPRSLRERERTEHAAILECLRAREAEPAGAAMEEHLRRYEGEMAEALEAVFGPPSAAPPPFSDGRGGPW